MNFGKFATLKCSTALRQPTLDNLRNLLLTRTTEMLGPANKREKRPNRVGCAQLQCC